MPRAESRLLAAIPVAVALAAHANTLPGDFIFDDVVLIKEGRSLHDFNLKRIFSSNYWGPDRTDMNYRPLTLLTYALNWQVSEGAWSFHLVNVLLNAGVALLAYCILVELLKDRLLASLGAALYTVLSLHTEAVANIVGRAELLAGLAIFGCWLIALKSVPPRSQGRGGWAAERTGPALAVGLLTFAGMLTKENVAVLFFLLPISSLILKRRIPWKALVSSILSIALYFLLRYLVVKSKIDGTSLVDNPLKFQDSMTRILNAVKLLGLYILKTVFPLRLSADYAYNQIPVLEPSDPLLWLDVALVVVPLTFGAWFSWRWAPLVTMAVAFFIIAFSLTANVLLGIGTMFGERLAYTPSFAYPLFLCALLQTKRLARWRGSGLAFISILILLYGARTWRRNMDWSDLTIMNVRMSEDAPQSTRSHFMAAVGHLELSRRAGSVEEKERENQKANEELDRSLEIDPTYGRAEAKRGEMLFNEGKYAEAAERLSKAGYILSRKNPVESEPFILFLRGQCYLQLQRFPEAFHDLDLYIKILDERSAPPNGVAHHYRALSSAALGQLEDALRDFNTAVSLRPDLPEIWNNRGFCRFKLKDFAGAIEDYRKGLDICLKEKIHQAGAPSFQRKIEDVEAEMARRTKK